MVEVYLLKPLDGDPINSKREFADRDYQRLKRLNAVVSVKEVDAQKAAEAQKAEEARKAAEAQKAEEARKAAEAQKAEEARKAAEAQKAEETEKPAEPALAEKKATAPQNKMRAEPDNKSAKTD